MLQFNVKTKQIIVKIQDETEKKRIKQTFTREITLI